MSASCSIILFVWFLFKYSSGSHSGAAFGLVVRRPMISKWWNSVWLSRYAWHAPVVAKVWSSSFVLFFSNLVHSASCLTVLSSKQIENLLHSRAPFCLLSLVSYEEATWHKGRSAPFCTPLCFHFSRCWDRYHRQRFLACCAQSIHSVQLSRSPHSNLGSYCFQKLRINLSPRPRLT